ncbi:MAG: CapA family protein, partial [Eggerthellaceae bacterium]|nr:CapA family protein [Eggerthellaceae bacterium]
IRTSTRSPYEPRGERAGRTGASTASSNRRPLTIAVAIAAILLLAIAGCTVFNHATSSTRNGLAAHIDSSAVAMKPHTLTFLAVGDIVPHKEMIAQSRTDDGSYDFNHVFDPVRSHLEPYDLLSVTQETPLVTDESRVGGYPIFGTPVQMGDAIVNAGFDIVTSATNHSMDQGIDGIFDTISYWKQNHPEIVLMGLHDDPADADGVTFVERNGITIAMTDLTYSLNGLELPAGEEYAVDMLYDLDAIAANVEAAQDKADITICYVHMGNEYATVPSAEQREVAERLIDAGADVVLGSHVHVVQPMEEVTTAAGNTGIVYFSLGNFASNQADVENMLGGAAVMTIAKIPHLDGSSETTVTAHEFIPVFCHYDYDTTQMYFLDDYTNELANSHFITLYGHPFTVEQVNGIWTDITGLPR